MDQEFPIDLDEVRRNVERAEVISLFFPRLRQTLVIDTRASAAEPPIARVMPMVRSAEERVREVVRLRPRFGRPGSITMIPWPRSVAGLKDLGVWQLMVDRLAGAGDPRSDATLERCYRMLVREERAEARRAVTGDGYKTLWQHSAT